ncbi:E3 ubiquitin-protein ligase Praja-2 [Ambystoma mexicanum]|uniref:E3 ubiquitin-protein ligase Praja-2 n=1 Tax=Ambystoma mexicanum TaxID=8296 RepID=UPI0037E98210
MGQEAGKPAWPKPAGGYQTITGRRYGRRHAYVSFRPSLANPERTPSQHSRECEGLELDDVQKEKPLFASESSYPLVPSACSPAFDGLSFQIAGPEGPVCASRVGQTLKNSLLNSAVPQTGTILQTFCSNSDPIKESRGFKVLSPDAHRPNGIAFVNIDSSQPDSSDGEEDGDFPQDCLSLTEEEGKLQKTLDRMLSELEKDAESLSGLQSHLSTLNRMDHMEDFCPLDIAPLRHSSCGMDLALQNNKRTVQRRRSTAEAEALPSIVNSSGFNSELQQKRNKTNSISRSSLSICNDFNATDFKVSSPDSSELVVRPKIRKQTSGSWKDGKKPRTTEESEEEEQQEEEAWNQTKMWGCTAESPPGRSWSPVRSVKEKMQNDLLFDPRDYMGAPKRIKDELDMQDKGAEQDINGAMDDDTFWEDFESYSRNGSGSSKDEISSDCSDGEWPACLPSYFTAEKGHSSGDDSWETLPGKEDQQPELQSNSSGLEEGQTNFCFQAEEQPSFEEGEITWLQYHEEIESSSEEENEQVSQFVHPGFFMLDGNNNLEDDSSMSEDLDVEWRLLDEFGDGIGVAQAISYVDPQFLTYMALEERLAQAMETALAHLESLAVDVEQAHPPASKESIDCLPQVVITEDHNAVGQEQCCAICCSEYIKEEVLTELPCRHFFHKPCVTIWLQKSGTCPVCRHVLTPVVPDAAATATSFLSDHESPPSIHSAAGTR